MLNSAHSPIHNDIVYNVNDKQTITEIMNSMLAQKTTNTNTASYTVTLLGIAMTVSLEQITLTVLTS